MTTGGKILLLSGCLAATGCATDRTVQVRAIPDPNGKLHYSGGLVGEARGQLVMGAVGLALESFQTLQREQPENADAYAGIAACYASMGRYDLTRRYYELALAYAPNDPALLQALASTLDKLGENEQAAQVRTEVRTAVAFRAQPSLPQPVLTPLGVPRATSMTVKLPAAAPIPAPPHETAIEIAPPKLQRAQVDLPAARTAFLSRPGVLASAAFDIPLAQVAEAAPRAPLVPEERSMAPSFALPAAAVALSAVRAPNLMQRPLEATLDVRFARAEESPVPPQTQSRVQQPLASAPRRIAQVEPNPLAVEQGPYLERTSLGEVALITIAHPANRATLRSRAPELPRMALIAAPPADRPPNRPVQQTLLAAASVRWVPLRYAARPQNIELLNAARTEGLASRTRVALVDRGWRKVRIGNARAVRQHSLVLYAAGRWHVAARLAAHFRCKAVQVASMKNVVVLLGRDAALRRGAISRA